MKKNLKIIFLLLAVVGILVIADFSEYATSFRKRCVMHDLTKQSIDYIAQKKTDWLILDTGLFRRNLCLLGDKKQTCRDRETQGGNK
ncbi:MAG: hypothetical protein BHV68_04205 [Bacteroidales bacterium 43_8]|nr:MAG: hypothetical protein BHV68_04205 [Bacteroidales bacterium 43_8]